MGCGFCRSKLKQTGVNYELLKKSYDSLKRENLRLKEELEELQSLKATIVTTCMLCNRNKILKLSGGFDG